MRHALPCPTYLKVLGILALLLLIFVGVLCSVYGAPPKALQAITPAVVTEPPHLPPGHTNGTAFIPDFIYPPPILVMHFGATNGMLECSSNLQSGWHLDEPIAGHNVMVRPTDTHVPKFFYRHYANGTSAPTTLEVVSPRP